MKRSEINALVRAASDCFAAHGWSLPPNPRWDVTDFGLGDWTRHALVLVNLAEEAEYCEKLMYAQVGMTTPKHYHKRKKEDVICRWGVLRVQVWQGDGPAEVKVNGEPVEIGTGAIFALKSGERITLEPATWHEFTPESEQCIIGEVSTANDDLNDNFFDLANVGRFPQVDEDEPPLVHLLSDR